MRSRCRLGMVALLGALVAACITTGGGGGTATPPASPVQAVAIIVHDFVSPALAVDGVAVTCNGSARGVTNGDGFLETTAATGAHFECTLSKVGYADTVAAFRPRPPAAGCDDCQFLRASLTRLAPPPPPPAPAAAWLRVRERDGRRYFETVDGALYDWREVSEFAALSRMLRGEAADVERLLRLLKAQGFTQTRVMLTLDGDYWHAHNPIGYSLRAAPDMPGYWTQLDALLRLHAQVGLRTRLVIFGALEPFGGAWDPIARRDIFSGQVQARAEAFALEVARFVAGRPEVVLEMANEPAAIGMKDSGQKLAGLLCRVKAEAPRTLANIGDVSGMPFDVMFDRCADFVDRHVDRNQGLDFLEAVKRMGEDAYRDDQPRAVPAVSGEPHNAGEARVDGRTGDVASRPLTAFGYGAVMRVRQILPTFHYDGGLWATAPKPETVACIEAFHQALDALPLEAMVGDRWRGHWGLARGDYWRDVWPDTDDIRTIEDHIRRGRGPWRAFGIGPWSVVFPEPLAWDWQANLDAPATRRAYRSDDHFGIGIYRRQ